MRELINENWLPQALVIGVPYDIFYSLNPKKMEPFHKAFNQQQEEKRSEMNYNAWLHGLYHFKAISGALAKNGKYLSQPIDFEEKNKLTFAQKAELWALAMNEEYYKKHPEERGEYHGT